MPKNPNDWLCGQIVQHTQDAVVFADRDGIIRLWNSGAEVMFGYRAEEAVGQTLDLIIPERLRARHWEGYRKVMATGVTHYGRELLKVPGIRKDGTRVSLEFSIVLLREKTGNLLGPAAIIRDVTERWEQEKSTKERLAALEAKVQRSGQPAS